MVAHVVYSHNLLATQYFEEYRDASVGYTALETRVHVMHKNLKTMMHDASILLLQECTASEIKMLEASGYICIEDSNLRDDGAFPAVAVKRTQCSTCEYMDGKGHGCQGFVVAFVELNGIPNAIGVLSVHATWGPNNRWVETAICNLQKAHPEIEHWLVAGDFNTEAPELGGEMVRVPLHCTRATHFFRTMFVYDHVFCKNLECSPVEIHGPSSDDLFLSHSAVGNHDCAAWHSDHAALRFEIQEDFPEERKRWTAILARTQRVTTEAKDGIAELYSAWIPRVWAAFDTSVDSVLQTWAIASKSPSFPAHRLRRHTQSFHVWNGEIHDSVPGAQIPPPAKLVALLEMTPFAQSFLKEMETEIRRGPWVMRTGISANHSFFLSFTITFRPL